MRPIDKGNIPLDKNGKPKTVSHYGDWRRDLVNRIGDYCCYCEMKLTVSPQVEHVIASKIAPVLNLSWENLILACRSCNVSKDDNPCPPDTHYLPDLHNTYLAFELTFKPNPKQNNEDAAFVIPSTKLSPPQTTKAKNTIQLCALDRDTTKKPLRVSDLRWKYRFQAYTSAVLWRNSWNKWTKTTDDFTDLLLTAARSTGFFSIWFRAFEDVPAVKKALIEGFPGTASDCFPATDNNAGCLTISNRRTNDSSYNPIWRNPPNDI